MAERLVVYVDGFNLYHGLHDQFGHRYLWLDLASLARSLRPHSNLVGVEYFTASVLNDGPAQSRQDAYIEALKAANPGLLHVTMGRYQQNKRRCRSCGVSWRVYEEKETDVNIAVTLAADAIARRADAFMVISGDSDIAPAIRLAMSLNPDARFLAAFPPGRFSAELQALMPSSFHIGRARIA
ncbi:NYN domain-containing protein [Leifsonia poae]|uniref:NYN domain-containing protein n=1 Tax=Leifsonia poae TaxID=110933 RepID=UPI003D6866F8